MAKLTSQLIEELYSYGKAVYNREISISDATDAVVSKYAGQIAESSASFYIGLYAEYVNGKGSTWNQNGSLVLYYIEHIFNENGIEVGKNAYEAGNKFARAKSKQALIDDINSLWDKLTSGGGDSVDKNEKVFESWLRNGAEKSYSESTVYRYVHALKKAEEWLGISLPIHVMDVTEIDDLNRLYDKIKAVQDFETINQSHGHGDLSAAMAAYSKFLHSSHKSSDAWWPTLEEYDPAISKDMWLELLNDGSTFTSNAYKAFAALYDCGGIATCRQLEEIYGESSDFYRTTMGVQLTSKVKKKLDIPICVDEDGKTWVWTIAFQGRKAQKDELGNYAWKVRPELYDALTEFGIIKYLQKGGMVPMNLSTKEAVDQIKAYISSKGFSYDDSLIENFYLSLKSKPFVILAGTSGTGKTRLVKFFAEAIGAEYKLVSVRPDWSDGSDLFGHNDLNGNFIAGPVCDAFDFAVSNPDKPVFLCLDEMNLARVEYYLSDFLSVIESREKSAAGKITTEAIAQYENGIPDNLYIIGTVNMDETTFPFSKKVLDRANTIEFSYVELTPNFESASSDVDGLTLPNSFLRTEYLVLARDCVEEKDYVNEICAKLEALNKILLKANAHVGYRVRDEIVFYMLNNKKADRLLDDNAAFDNEIMQKILPRIQGSSSSIKNMLTELFKYCRGNLSGLDEDSQNLGKQMQNLASGAIYPVSAAKIGYMMTRYEEDGFTSYWL